MLAQNDQFVGLDGGGGALGHLVQTQIKNLAGQGMPQTADQNHVLHIQVALDRPGIDRPHGTGVLHIHAVDHAQGPGLNHVAANHADLGVGHGGVGQALG